MLRWIISTVISLVIIYLVLTFVYDNFVEVRPMMDDAKSAIIYAYNYFRSRWGAVAVGGIIIFGLIALSRR